MEGERVTFARLVALPSEDGMPLGEYELRKDEYIIGRTPDNDICVAREDVSRRHARIVRSGPRYLLYDTQSVNGTFVNNQELASGEGYLLKDRDLLSLGQNGPTFRFIDPDRTALNRPKVRLSYDSRLDRFDLDGKTLNFTPQQSKLMRYLCQHPNQVCAQPDCEQAVWTDYEPGANDLNRVIAEVRSVLNKIAPDTMFIITHRGVGFRLNPAGEPRSGSAPASTAQA